MSTQKEQYEFTVATPEASYVIAVTKKEAEEKLNSMTKEEKARHSFGQPDVFTAALIILDEKRIRLEEGLG